MNNPAVIKAYEQIALTRDRSCSGCGSRIHLSHSHLIPRSYREDLEADIKNITFHCLSVGKEGCHHKWEGMKAPELKDFVANMLYIYEADQTYFWKRYFKLKEYWEHQYGNVAETRMLSRKCLGAIQRLHTLLPISA